MTKQLPLDPNNEIIAAIASAQGQGGIGIVRLSGAGCIEIADKLFRAQDGLSLGAGPDRTLSYGHIIDPITEAVIDEALAVAMRAPRSYTREDVVEIDVHGGAEPLRRTLAAALAAGARLAEPGEFTRRAFLNGRIDLAQAEAVIDIISARTQRASAVATRQLQGALSKRLVALEIGLSEILAELEAAVDFSDEDLGAMPRETILTTVDTAAKSVDTLLVTASGGELVRSGVRLAIIGRPNVGKSSLLNALLRRDRAIVTPLPGTTRDVLEETIAIDGIPFIVIDTAGIRHTDDAVESQGVERSRRSMAEADIVALVVDASAGLIEEDRVLLSESGPTPTLIIANKSDLLEKKPARSDTKHDDAPHIYVSAKTGAGIDALGPACLALVLGGRVLTTDDVLVSNARHSDALRRTALAIAHAREALSEGLSEEFAAGEIRNALACVGEITGRDVSADILDRIFERFCIGK